MSLITRCPACGTMFKVVADQLKVSQGWVRCGHCAEVFDASAYLLADDAVALAPPVLTSDDVAAIGQATQAAQPHGAPESGAPPEPIAASMAPTPDHGKSFAGRLPLMPALAGQDDAQESADDFDPASWKQARQKSPCLETQAENVDVPPRRPDLVHTASVDASGVEIPYVADSTSVDADVAPIDVANDETPDDVSFVRDARRKAFWKKPLARWSLGALSLLLLAALALQWTMQQKDTLAALQPRLAPLLQTLCAALRCEVRLPRHIESVVIDSSSFNRLGPDVYRLSFAFKNTGAIPLETPSLEVTLTDTRDHALVRRVLAPAQFGVGTGTLAAHSVLAGTVTMNVSGDGEPASAPSSDSSAPSLASVPLRVAGYRILAFYP